MHKKFNSILAVSMSALLFIENACVGYAYAADEVSVFKLDCTTSSDGIDTSLELGGNLDICGFSAELIYDKTKYSISEESLDAAEVDDSALINDKPSKGKLMISFTGTSNITEPVKVFDLHIDCSGTPSKDDLTLKITDAYNEVYEDKDYKIVVNWNGETSEETPVTTAVPVPVTTTSPAPATTAPAPATTDEKEIKTTAVSPATSVSVPVTTAGSATEKASSDNNIFYVVTDNSDPDFTLLTFGVRGTVRFAGVDGTISLRIEDDSLVSKVKDSGGMMSNYDTSMKKIRFTYSNPKAKNTVKPEELFTYKLPKLTDKEIEAIKLNITEAYDDSSSDVVYSISYSSEGSGEVVTVPATTTKATTAVPVTTVTETTAAPVTTIVTNIPGDVNLDGTVDLSDTVALKQHLGNPEKYPLSEQAAKNADVYKDGVIDDKDADTIQEYLAKIVKELPVIPSAETTATTAATKAVETTTVAVTTTPSTIPGDVNMDGIVDLSDGVALKQHVGNPEKYPLSEQAAKNADVYQDGVLDDTDADTIQEYLAKIITKLPVIPSEVTTTATTTKAAETTTVAVTTTPSTIPGDVNMDGIVDLSDGVALKQHIGNPEKYPLSEQAAKNADVYQDGVLDDTDADTIQEYLAKIITKLPVIPSEVTTTAATTKAAETTTVAVTTTPSTIPGDVNMDGIVDLSDGVALKQHIGNSEKYPLSEQAAKNADVYQDGVLDDTDADTIQEYLAKIITKLPVIPSEVTTTAATTKTAETTTVAVTTTPSTIPGDVNMDGIVDLSDGVALRQHIGNPEKYPLSEQAAKNADVYQDGIIDVTDADTIQEYLAKIITKLPVIPSEVTTTAATTKAAETTTEPVTTTPSTIPGDVNMDGIVDITDAVILGLHLDGDKELSDQALKNADVYKDGTVDVNDKDTLQKYLAKLIPELPVEPEDIPETTATTSAAPETTTVPVSTEPSTKPGDVNMDGMVDISDSVLLNKYLNDPENNPLSEQAQENADVYKDGRLTASDSETIVKYISSIVKELPVDPEATAETAATSVTTTVPVTTVSTTASTVKPSDTTSTSTEKAATTEAKTTATTAATTTVVVTTTVTVTETKPTTSTTASTTTKPVTTTVTTSATAAPTTTTTTVPTTTVKASTTAVPTTKPVTSTSAVPTTIPTTSTTAVPTTVTTTASESTTSTSAAADTTTIQTTVTETETTTTTTIVTDICGDVNVDGTVEVADLILLKKHIADPENSPLTSQGAKNADTYKDGVLDSKDTDALLNYISKIIDELPVLPEKSTQPPVSVTTNAAATTTATETETETKTATTTPVISKLCGDINSDGSVDVGDAVALKKYIADPENTELTLQELKNADVYQDGVIDSKDSETLLAYLGHSIDTIPVIPEKPVTTTAADTTEPVTTTTAISKVPGDVNNDSTVDMSDLVTLMAYVSDPESAPLSEQALENADVYKDGVIDSKDTDTLVDFLADLITELPVEPKAPETTTAAPETTAATETTAEETTATESTTASETTSAAETTTETTTAVPETTTVTATEPVPVTTEPAQTPDYVLGDVNLDGIIDANDASKILEIYAKYSSGDTPAETEAQLRAAEVDNDRMITSSDASLILAYYASVSTGEDIKFEDYLAANGIVR
ncbi:MAG: hypothetical protein J5501_10520 [Ruminococcus sp.]|nr:hypothetical protein [Ruminococcus sp.]